MPKLDIDFSGVETFENLPVGVYEGHVEKIEHREPKEDGKSEQLSVTLIADGGEQDGQKTWQNLYLTAKAMFRVKKFFDLFGLAGEALSLDYDDDSGLLLEPALDGEPVRFKVYQSGTYQGQPSMKAEVIEWLGGKRTAAKASMTAKPAAAAPARRTLR